MLDSFPLGGGITSFEALAAGVPILTLPSAMVAWKFAKVGRHVCIFFCFVTCLGAAGSRLLPRLL